MFFAEDALNAKTLGGMLLEPTFCNNRTCFRSILEEERKSRRGGFLSD